MARHAVMALLLAAVVAPAWGQGAGLTGLARIEEGQRSRRISSTDRTGANRDWLPDIQPGQRVTLAEIEGAGIINHIWMTIAPPPDLLNRHDLILRMYWDGESEPSVEAPVGDFFGQGWGEAYNWQSLPLAAGPLGGRGLVCYFPMPFGKGARIEIENDSERVMSHLYYYVDYQEMDRLPEEMGRFHAHYRHETTAPPAGTTSEMQNEAPLNRDGGENYLIAEIEGQGHFVGVNYYVTSPSPIWYGEGDDFFFIDGETTASLKGTGTEDYFNTSWSPKEIYMHPLYGYARVNNESGHLGRTHVYRFHINDPVRFEKSLTFSIEHGHGNALTLDMHSVAYWYQTEPHKAFGEFPSREERAPKSVVTRQDIFQWRQDWLKGQDDPGAWGNERE